MLPSARYSGGAVALPTDMVSLLKVAYSAESNDVRREAVKEVLRRSSSMDVSDKIACAGMLLTLADRDVGASCAPAVRAYGATLLRQSIEDGSVPASEVPYESLMGWYQREGGSMHSLIRDATASLLVTVATRLWPTAWPSFLGQCAANSSSQLAANLHLMNLLTEFYSAVVDDTMNLPALILKKLQSSLREVASDLLGSLIRGQMEWVATVDRESSTGEVVLSTSRERHAHAALLQSVSQLRMLCVVFPVPQRWWELQAHLAVERLFAYSGTRTAMIEAWSEVMAIDELASPADANMVVLLRLLLQHTTALVVAAPESSAEVLESVLVALARIPPAMFVADQHHVAQFVTAVLSVPSVHFAVMAMDLFLASVTVCDVMTDPVGFLERLFLLCQEHAVNPTFSRRTSQPCSSAAMWSTMQYGEGSSHVEENFLEDYQTLKRKAALVLRKIGEQLPQIACQGCIYWVSVLPTLPCSNDKLNASGTHADRKSSFVSLWNAVQFMVENLAPTCFCRNEALGRNFLDHLGSKQIADPVVAPCLLGMMRSVWEPSATWSEEAQQSVWTGSVAVLFALMQLVPLSSDSRKYGTPSILADDVVVAARYSAFRLFADATANNGAAIQRVPQLLTHCHQILMGSNIMPSERLLVYEAIAALSNQMSAEEQQKFLQPTLTPLMDRIVATDIQNFALIVCGGSSGKDDAQRKALQRALGEVHAVVRRSSPSPYLIHVVTSLVPPLSHLLSAIHAFTPHSFPPGFELLFGHASSLASQTRTLHAAKKPGTTEVPDEAVDRARSCLNQIRVSLYGIMGQIGRYVPLESYGTLFVSLVRNLSVFPVLQARAFVTSALFEWVKACPSMATVAWKPLASFLDVQGARNDLTKEDLQSLFHFMWDIREHIVSYTATTPNWRHLMPGVDLEEQLVVLLNSMIRSGFEPKGCMFLVRQLMHEQRLSDAAGSNLFVTLVSNCVANPRHVAKDCEVIAGILVDMYTKRVVHFTECLDAAGFPRDAVQGLNGSLSCAGGRHNERRAVFLSFVRNVCCRRQ